MDPHELERLIDRELRALPGPRAPRTLVPRLMQAVRTGRPAPVPSVWPGIVLVMSVMACIAAIPWIVGSSVALEKLLAAVKTVSLAISIMQVAWRALFEPIVTYAAVVLLLTAFLCSALWKALRFVASEGASHS
jgi:hypothetical protein